MVAKINLLYLFEVGYVFILFLTNENIRVDTKIADLLRVQVELHKFKEYFKMASKMSP